MDLPGGKRGEKPAGYIGCCGAYCKTCRAFTEGFCKGCKLGYAGGERKIEKAKCAIKLCCFGKRNLETCADCPEYPEYRIIHGFYGKKGFKYRKYKQAVEFIKEHGYAEFLKLAREWKGAYGRLE